MFYVVYLTVLYSCYIKKSYNMVIFTQEWFW